MPPNRTSMSAAAIEQLITQHVADALLTYEANQNIGNGMEMETTMEIEVIIKEMAVECRCTLLVAYNMTWKSLMKRMTKDYCSRSEIKKLDIELWNLTVKGTDVVSYTQRFQELALLCSRMVHEESNKMEK
ncbi:reverse transcriptase domain-containing protein [Tanacetum coccineum]